MRLITVTGTPYERGEQIGSALAPAIRDILACQENPDTKAAGKTLHHWLPEAQRFLPVIEQHAPRVLDEMRGCAHGSGLHFDEILLLTCAYEHWMAAKLANHCTAFGLLTSDGRVLAGQNNDELAKYWADARHDCVIRHRHHDNLAAAIYTHPGIPAYMGINSTGLCLTWMYIDNGQRQVGLPTNVLIREFLYHRDFNAALHWLTTIAHAVPNTFLIAAPSHQPAIVEAAPGRVVVRRGDALAHGNTVTEPALLPDTPMPPACRRQTRLQELVDASPNPTTEQARDFLLDTQPLGEQMICNANTLASMVFDTDRRTMHIAFGPKPHGDHMIVNLNDADS